MTYVLVALMMIEGALNVRIIEHDSRNACESAAQGVRATYPAATVTCIVVTGAKS